MRAPEVSVVVVSWNTRELLAGCLESMWAEVEADRAEVCVVDNASTDGSQEMVAEQYPWATLIASSENRGFGAAVNLAARRAAGKWIAPANADIRLGPGAMEHLLSAGDRDPEAGAIAPRLISPDGSTQHSVFPFPTVPFTLMYNLGLFGLSNPLGDRWCVIGRWDPERSRPVPWAVGAFLIVRREAWAATGGFDEELWMYAEDLDLGWRLREAGWQTRYEPSALVHHEGAASTSQAWGDDRALRWHRSTYAWLIRRRGPLVTRSIALLNVVGASVRAALLAPAAALRPGRWGIPLHTALNTARAHRVGLARKSIVDQYR